MLILERRMECQLDPSDTECDSSIVSEPGQREACSSRMFPPFVCQHGQASHGMIPTIDATKNGPEAKAPRKSPGAFELKFIINERCALDIMEWARIYLDPDPHSDAEVGDGYRVNSLYLDTSQFDVLQRAGVFEGRKYRLRRYGRESRVWLEEKRKRKSFVRKRRVSVGDLDLSTLFGQIAEVNWDGIWFRRKVDQWNLRPICQITYQRFARLKETDDGPVRMTIDNQLVASRADGWHVPVDSFSGASLLNGTRILELKFRSAMPVVFHELIEQHQLQVTSFSKYRESFEKCPSLKALLCNKIEGL